MPEYLSGGRIQGTSTEEIAVTALGAGFGTPWKELARSNHTSTGNTLTALSGGSDEFTPKDHMMYVFHATGAGSAGLVLEFGTGSGFDTTHDGGGSDYYNNRYNGNYASSSSDSDDKDNGGIYAAYDAHTHTPNFGYGTIINIDGKEHLVMVHGMMARSGDYDSGIRETVGKYSRTDQITQARIKDTWGAGFTAGAELIILGCDADDADSGSPFWEQLVYKTSTSVDTADIAFDTGLFAKKKYLWIQVHTKAKSGEYANAKWQFNGDTGSNYRTAYSDDGNADPSQSNADSIMTRAGEHSNSNAFTTAYINNSLAGAEKQYIGHTTQIKTGAVAPARNEWHGKWKDTSEQIERLVLKSTSGSGNNMAEATITVWGHD